MKLIVLSFIIVILISGCTQKLEQPQQTINSEKPTTINTKSRSPIASVNSATLELLDLARKKVVYIEGGTGFFIRPNGYLVTNAHVVINESGVKPDIEVITFDGTKYKAKLIGVKRNDDIAILKIEKNYPYFEFWQSSELKEGDTVFVIGHPGDVGYWIVTKGKYIKIEQTVGLDSDVNKLTEWMLTTADANNGNSGGPVVNLEMKVVGVVTGTTSHKLSPPQIPQKIQVVEDLKAFIPPQYSTAVPSDLAIRIIEEILNQ